jgi:hypothetical protein
LTGVGSCVCGRIDLVLVVLLNTGKGVGCVNTGVESTSVELE